MAGFPSVDTNPTAVSDFVLKWLSQHLDPQLINGQLIAGRPDMAEFINEWIELSEAMGGPPGQLNMRVAPFRLLAIVNRLDLRDAPSEYGGGNAGEGRFVYNFLNIPDELITALQSGQDVPVDPSTWATRFGNVILEYRLVAEKCGDVVEWANRWHALGALPFGAQYNAALQAITDDFAGFNADPSAPNGSALNQLRTNEIEFSFSSSLIWELREFKLLSDAVVAPLEQVVVALTVRTDLDDSALLGDWMTQNEIAINHDEHTIPLSFNGQPFAAGSSLNPAPLQLGVSSFFWEVPDPFDFDCSDTRFNFAINNCNGCHAREADVSNFFQVNPRITGAESVLTEFLTGTPEPPPPPPGFIDGPGTPDPTCAEPPLPGAVVRFFNDIARRAFDLCDIIQTGCDDQGDNAALNANMDIFKTPNMLKLRVH
jgi:hypothetical protein